jgi:hypothetical protein
MQPWGKCLLSQAQKPYTRGSRQTDKHTERTNTEIKRETETREEGHQRDTKRREIKGVTRDAD